MAITTSRNRRAKRWVDICLNYKQNTNYSNIFSIFIDNKKNSIWLQTSTENHLCKWFIAPTTGNQSLCWIFLSSNADAVVGDHPHFKLIEIFTQITMKEWLYKFIFEFVELLRQYLHRNTQYHNFHHKYEIKIRSKKMSKRRRKKKTKNKRRKTKSFQYPTHLGMWPHCNRYISHCVNFMRHQSTRKWKYSCRK